MKLSNFASLDPAILATGRRGLAGSSVLDREIWEEFRTDWERLALECEQLRQKILRERGQQDKDILEIDNYFMPGDYSGETRRAIVQQRIKQAFFRRSVLASYGGRCCISGVSDARFLVASHIVPWSKDKANRLNPSNGLCLSSIHDRAFDQHLFSLTDDHHILLSVQLKESKDTFLQQIFWPLEGHSIELPDKFHPAPELLRRHRETMLSHTT
ncbi:MAG: HNH endonuclease [Lysobacteraceae bacterium]